MGITILKQSFSQIANNAAYQAQLRAIRQHRADSLIEEAQRFNGDLSGFQRIADMRLEHANVSDFPPFMPQPEY